MYSVLKYSFNKIIEDGGKSNNICALSQAVIKIPFITKCNHFFEESVAFDYIKENQGRVLKCPVVGCNHPFCRKEQK